jgi:hypothetical protein
MTRGSAAVSDSAELAAPLRIDRRADLPDGVRGAVYRDSDGQAVIIVPVAGTHAERCAAVRQAGRAASQVGWLLRCR